MNISQKVFLVAVIPMLVAMLLSFLAVNYQTQNLSQKQADAYKTALLETRKKELSNYVDLAKSAIKHIDQSPDLSSDASQLLASRILTDLEYSEDGYFYAYTEDGTNVVHPKQPFRLGKNWWDLQDSEGKPVIQALISEAKKGGGFTEYLWEKPSLGQIAKKLGYSEMLDSRPWMVGTGMYIDDLDNEVATVQEVMDKHIKDTSNVLMSIAALSVIIVFFAGLALQINERKMADIKLQALTKRVMDTQDEERRRVSRELHDGISQSLIGIKYSLDAAYEKIDDYDKSDAKLIKDSSRHLDDVLYEIRRISRDLHPSILDDLGLMAAIEALVKEFQHRSGIQVTINRLAIRNLLPQDVKTALYRVTQEALTNIERHAAANNISIDFSLNKSWFQLKISDDGQGFDVSTMRRNRRPSVGVGLRNMSERLSYYKGKFDVQSSDKGTTITVSVPKTILALKKNQLAAN